MVWSVAAVGVWVWTTRYEFSATPSNVNQFAHHWPADTQLVLAKGRPTLLFFLHPRCPCTRASIRELQRVFTTAQLSAMQQPKLLVVATVPFAASEQWHDSDTLRSAKQLPLSQTIWDMGGCESKRFGAETSGATLLYDQRGKLLFAGGVTISRGHEGSSTGGERLRQVLCQQTAAPLEPLPVFGCRLCISPDPPAGSVLCSVECERGPQAEGAEP